MADVEQRHREAAIDALAVALKQDAPSGIHTIAQALADAEQRGAESAKAEAQAAGTGWVSVETAPEDRVILTCQPGDDQPNLMVLIGRQWFTDRHEPYCLFDDDDAPTLWMDYVPPPPEPRE